MKRPLIKAIFVGFVALAVSGWGNLLTVSLCPHMGFAVAQTVDAPQATQPTGRSCHSSATPTPQTNAKSSIPTQTSDSRAVANSILAEMPDVPCSMDVSQGLVLGANGGGSSLTTVVQNQTVAARVPAIHFWPNRHTITYRQGAPPVGRTRSHLTLGVIQT